MNRTNPALIGAFIIGGVLLLLISVIYFARISSNNGTQFIVYFSESTNGLNIGAPVKMGGVSIGSVTDIVVLADEQAARVMTAVIIQIQNEKVFNPKGQPVKIDSKFKKGGDELAKAGIRAQLNLQSLVTGQLYVDIEFHPNTPVKLYADQFSFKNHLIEIPTVPSSKEKLSNTVEAAVSEFRKLPIEETSQALLAAIKRVELLLNRPEIISIMQSGEASFTRLNTTLDHLNTHIDPILAHLDATLTETHELARTIRHQSEPVLQHLDATLVEGDHTLMEARKTLRWLDDPRTKDALQTSLDELGNTARSVRTLTDYLQRNPNSLITGKSALGD